MNPAVRKFAFPGVCAGALAAGFVLGSQKSERHASIERTPDHARPARLSHSGHKSDTEPVSKSLMLRRTVARCDTDALWAWLEAGDTDCHDIEHAVVVELIDRLGWSALDRAFAFRDEETRERLSGLVLSVLAERDPWKALEEYQDHRGEFENPLWGEGVISQCTIAAAATSADKLIDIFRQMTREDSELLMTVPFSRNFDFGKVLDHLFATEAPPRIAIENLMPAWAERSPEDAANWLVTHPGYLDKEYQNHAAAAALKAMATADMEDGKRIKALEAMSSLPGKFLTDAWAGIASDSEGKITASVLQSADQMGVRESYLSGALLSTRGLDEIDPTWELVPLEERLEILERVDRQWAEETRTPVEVKARERWMKMVGTAWGMSL